MPLGALVPIVAGLIGAGSALATNASNRRQTREQMEFQERMSSTAAQRSVQDYTAAGLNPALAYERTASSPSGSVIGAENAGAAGAASARETAALMQQMKIAKAQSDADLLIKKEQQATTRAQNMALTADAQLSQLRQTNEWLNQQFAMSQRPHMDRQAAATALQMEYNARLAGLAIPGAENTANYERRLGELKGVMGSARTISEIIKNFRRW